MKKTLTLALSVILALAMMLCASALVLDTAETAEGTVVEEAVLAASGTAPSFSTYDPTYGELIYFEDFSDNSWSNGYSIGSNAYMYGEGCTIDVGDGYGIGGSATTLIIDNTYLSTLSDVTIFMDVKKAPGSTKQVLTSGVTSAMAGPSFLCPM